MIEISISSAVAVRVLELWLLAAGFQPTGYFDSKDPACVRVDGPHQIYTIQARVPEHISIDRHFLLNDLQRFLDKQAALPSAIRFHAYDIEVYNSPFCGNYIFASIEYTA